MLRKLGFIVKGPDAELKKIIGALHNEYNVDIIKYNLSEKRLDIYEGK